MNDEPFFADCPHCCLHEFRDQDDWFEHVSMCEWEWEQDRLRDEEE